MDPVQAMASLLDVFEGETREAVKEHLLPQLSLKALGALL